MYVSHETRRDHEEEQILATSSLFLKTQSEINVAVCDISLPDSTMPVSVIGCSIFTNTTLSLQ